MRSGQRLHIIVATLLLSMLLMALATPPFAQAKGTAKDLPAVTCYKTITTPQVSRGHITSTSSVSCSGTVYSISVTTTLYVGSRMLDSRTNYSNSSFASSAAFGCYTGYYSYYAVLTGYWTDQSGTHTMRPLNSYSAGLRC